MKKFSTAPRRFRAGFTLVELLTVIAIIGILAAMLLPVLSAVKKHALVVRAHTEISDIVTGIQGYDQDYGRFPVTSAEQSAAGVNDFTTGLLQYPQAPLMTLQWPKGSGPNYSYDNNSNVVAILMDMQTYPNGTQTADYGHVKNPKQRQYINPKMSGYDPIGAPVPNPPGGVDNTGVYRDPWGNPYIITMDTSYDDQCSDLFYCQQRVSQNPYGGTSQAGFNGLFNPNSSNPASDNFLFHGKVMAWSAGPDGKIDRANSANTGVNKDNVLSWQ